MESTGSARGVAGFNGRGWDAENDRTWFAGRMVGEEVIAHITWYEREMIGMLKAMALEGSDLWQLPQDDRFLQCTMVM